MAMAMAMRRGWGIMVAGLLATAGCGGGGSDANGTTDAAARDAAAAAPGSESTSLLSETLRRSTALADSIEDLLRPVPLMRPADEAALRRYRNAAHVARARELGERATDDARIAALLESGEYVRLQDSTSHWIVREGVTDRAIVTPDVPPLLREIGERFQAELDERGLPPYRIEITSVLRTAAGQAALRQRNVNAAAGTSSHEFGTTLDIAYEAFAPPQEVPEAAIAPDAPEPLRPELERVASLALESVSARKSRELTAILAEVLTDLQNEGAVLVILERLQPVFHITVARRSAQG